MEMKDLNGKNVYVAARSLTVKDNDGKTRGIVRNISFWKNLAPRVQFDMVHKHDFRKSGIWGNHELMCRIIFKDNKPYYLLNERAVESGIKFHGEDYANKIEKNLESLKAANVEVIRAANVSYSRNFEF